MVYTVSITSQGQISIPAQLRKQLGLESGKKALVKREGERLMVEPIPDIFSFKGSLKHKAIKGKTIDEIIEIEGKAWEQAAVERYKQSFSANKNALRK